MWYTAVKLAAIVTMVTQCLAAEDWNLVWEDDFEKFDHNKWQQEITAWGGGNQEFQVYTNERDNCYTKDGVLYLKPTLTTDRFGDNVFNDGVLDLMTMYGQCSQPDSSGCYRTMQDIPPVMSARIRTFTKFSFKHGRAVIEAKMPAGDWLWPAMWLLPENWVYGGWPLSGEMDIVEIIGNRNFTHEGKNRGIQHMGSALHWGPDPSVNKYFLTTGQQDNVDQNYADYWHTYELEWNDTRIVTYVDGKEVMRVPPDEEMAGWTGFYDWGMRNGGMDGKPNPWTDATDMAPFDQAFHLILNVAVGGTNGFIPDGGTNYGGAPKPWVNGMSQRDGQIAFWADKDNWYPTWNGEDAAMKVRNIKVYQYGEVPPAPTTAVPPSPTPTPPDDGWDLVFEDNFETFDHNKWQHEINAWGGGNQEFQMYTNEPANSYVKDNVLYLKPTLTNDTFGNGIFDPSREIAFMWEYGYCTHWPDGGCYRTGEDIPPVMSARIRTFERFSYKYGKAVIEAKMPAGDWLWPAMWLLPEDWVYGGWPLSGEMDIVEIIGNRDLKRGNDYLGVQHMGSALHWGPDPSVNKYFLTTGQQVNEEENYADFWHTYEIEWDPEKIVTRVDGKEVMKIPPDSAIQDGWTGFYDWGMKNGGMNGHPNPWEGATDMAPFDQAFHLILNVAVGGTNGFIPDDGVNAGGARPKPWVNGVGQRDGQTAFWADRDNWYPTWKGEDAAMKVRNVKVYQWREGYPEPTRPTPASTTTTPTPSPSPTPEPTTRQPSDNQGWNLIWEDDFESLTFDNWQHEITAWGGGNREFQVYTNDPDNSYVKDGVLYLKPTLTADKYGETVFNDGKLDLMTYGFCSQSEESGCYREGADIPPIMSARLRSFQRFSYKYGKAVIEAKMPAGDWLWPAMWLLPEDWVYGGWPMSGEIDIVEIIGNRDLKRGNDYLGVQHMGSALHWGPRWDVNKYFLTNGQQENVAENYADYWHTYELEWNETRIITRVDGKVVMKIPPDEDMAGWTGFWDWGMRNGGMGGQPNPWTDASNMAPFDQAFHLILNVAVGGTNGFIPDDGVNAGGSRPKPWVNGMSQRDGQVAFWADKDNWYPTWEGEQSALRVRNIKVYQWGDIVEPEPTPTAPVCGSSFIKANLVTMILTVVFLLFK